MGTKILIFGDMSWGLTKQKLNCNDKLYIWGKRRKLWSLRTTSQLWSLGATASCCGAVLLQKGLMHFTKQMERKQYTLRQHLKTSATTLNLGCKLVFRMDNDPKHTSKLVTKCFKDNKVRVSEWPSQSPDLSPTEDLWAALKRWVTARRPTNPAQLHQFCLSVSPDSRKLLRKFVEGNLKRLAEVKQFDSNSTKY